MCRKALVVKLTSLMISVVLALSIVGCSVDGNIATDTATNNMQEDDYELDTEDKKLNEQDKDEENYLQDLENEEEDEQLRLEEEARQKEEEIRQREQMNYFLSFNPSLKASPTRWETL